MTCFEYSNVNDNALLSRIGVIKLLDTIRKQYPDIDICISRDEMKKNITNHNAINVRQISDGNNYNMRTDQYTYLNQYRRGSQFRNTYHQINNNRSKRNDRKSVHGLTRGPHRETHRPLPVLTHSRTYHNSALPPRNNRKMNTNRKVGCYNCGEYNHRQDICRFDHKLKCGNCGRLGHKSKLCDNYSN